MALFLRILIGLVLLVSGLEKLISPYQNFMYVIEAYAFLPSWLERIAALSVPWVELFIGIFLVVGLWTDAALKGALLLFGSFIIIVGQALIRHLPIDQCGCFGGNIHISPSQIIVFDSLVVLSLYWLLRNSSKALRFSLDKTISS